MQEKKLMQGDTLDKFLFVMWLEFQYLTNARTRTSNRVDSTRLEADGVLTCHETSAQDKPGGDRTSVPSVDYPELGLFGEREEQDSW